MQSLDELFDTFDLNVDSVRYDHRARTMTANVTFTIPMSRFDEEAHEGLATRFDAHVDDQWNIRLGDYDEGTHVAWFKFRIEARSIAACRYLQKHVACTPRWFEETTHA